MLSDTTKKLLCFSTAGLAICMCNPCLGDVDYRIVDLGKIGFLPDGLDTSGSFGIKTP